MKLLFVLLVFFEVKDGVEFVFVYVYDFFSGFERWLNFYGWRFKEIWLNFIKWYCYFWWYFISYVNLVYVVIGGFYV